MMTRRSATWSPLVLAGLAGLVLMLAQPAAAQFVNSPVLAKFAQNLRGVGPAGIPVAVPDGVRAYRGFATADHYTINIEQFQDTLHPALPPTTLWGYNPQNALGVAGVPTPKHLGGIIVGQRGRPTQITFRNNLPPSHILPVDTTLMGAADPQNRTSTHLHGGFVPWTSDGGPFATWDPLGAQGPSFMNNVVLRPGQVVPANEAEFYYPNQQSARFMWYHDHAIGITRLNAYAGVATAYLLRDLYESKILVAKLGLPNFIELGGRELPLVIQDKIFLPADDPTYPGSAKTAGSLWYPFTYDPNRWALNPGGLPLPAVSVVPEMFGDTLLANGTVFPKVTIDPRRLRLRILNACQARFVNLQLYEDDGTGKPNFALPGPPFLVIGAEGGFLAKPVSVPSAPLTVITDVAGNRSVDPAAPGGALITAPAERWDLVVDFNGMGGRTFIICNDAPAPFPMGAVVNDYPTVAGVGDTQTLLQIVVNPNGPAIPADATFKITTATNLAGDLLANIDKPLAGANAAALPAQLSWLRATPAALPIPTRAGVTVRQVTLNEGFDGFGRLIQMQGNNIATAPGDFSRPYDSPATETPTAGTTEVWQIVNLTADTHPIHFHLVNAQILSRQAFDVLAYQATPMGTPATPVLLGLPRGPAATELGWKETIKTNPGEVTTVIMKFNLPRTPFVVPTSPRTGGYEYVWHCHILDHEEHDMMRPLIVQP